MKKKVHPKYQNVLFVDSATGTRFVCGSTLQPKETEKFEGVEYPVYRISISAASHPLFTGSKQLVDAEGRVDKFRKRYAAKAASIETASKESGSKGSGKQAKPAADKAKKATKSKTSK